MTNPNFFGASFQSIKAEAYYPTNKTVPLGGGTLDNVNIKAHSNTTINFPFQVSSRDSSSLESRSDPFDLTGQLHDIDGSRACHFDRPRDQVWLPRRLVEPGTSSLRRSSNRVLTNGLVRSRWITPSL